MFTFFLLWSRRKYPAIEPMVQMLLVICSDEYFKWSAENKLRDYELKYVAKSYHISPVDSLIRWGLHPSTTAFSAVSLMYTQGKKKRTTLRVHFLKIYEDNCHKNNNMLVWIQYSLEWKKNVALCGSGSMTLLSHQNGCGGGGCKSDSRQQMSETQTWVRPLLHCTHLVPIKDHRNGIRNHNVYNATTVATSLRSGHWHGSLPGHLAFTTQLSCA